MTLNFVLHLCNLIHKNILWLVLKLLNCWVGIWALIWTGKSAQTILKFSHVNISLGGVEKIKLLPIHRIEK